MLCGPNVPSLWSVWGAVRNRQLCIVCMYCKGCIFFLSIFQFFQNLHNLTQKNNSFFFILIYTAYREKKTRIYNQKKKMPDVTIFLYTSYIFHTPTKFFLPWCKVSTSTGQWAQLIGST